MLRAVVAVAAIVCVARAWAQVAGSATLVSDERFRGISLSDDRPAAQLALNYDLPSGGWYAGGMMSSARLDARAAVQLLGYAGYARRLTAQLSWDAGVRYTRFTGRESYDYAEAYAGLGYRQATLRVYYAPDYFGFGAPVLYAELDGSHALARGWYVFGHLGYLRRSGNVADDHTSRFRSDLQAGVGLALSSCDIQLGWTTVRGARRAALAYGYPVGMDLSRDALVLRISYAW